MDEEKKEALLDLILDKIEAEPDEVEKIELKIIWKPKAKKPKQD